MRHYLLPWRACGARVSGAGLLLLSMLCAASCGQTTFDFLPSAEGGGEAGIGSAGSNGAFAGRGGAGGDDTDAVCRTTWDCDDNGGCPPGSRFCKQCFADNECGAPQSICSTTFGVCVGCRTERDCPVGLRCDPLTFLCGFPCEESTMCNGEHRICDPARGTCVDCLDDSQCRNAGAMGPGGRRQYCVAGECVQCYRAGQCPTEAPFCVNFSCRECLQDADCKQNKRCRLEIGMCDD